MKRLTVLVLAGMLIALSVSCYLLYEYLLEQYLPNGIPLHKSTAVLELKEHEALLGNLTSTFSITQVDQDTVNIVLMAYFISNENSLRSIQLKATLMVGVYDYNVLMSMRFPAPPVIDYQLENGDSIVLVDRTFNLSRYQTLGVAIAYGIRAIELRFFNGSTVLLGNFTQGKCSVTPQATISMVKGFSGGIAPLWEGEYEYPPSLVIYSLDELKAKFLLRRVTVNMDQSAYTAETHRSIDQTDEE